MTPSRFSSAGLIDQLLVRLQESEHERWSSLVTPLGYASLVLAAAVVLLGVGFSRFIRLGGATVAAGALVLAGALLIRFVFGLLGDDGAIGDEARAIANTLAGAPIRNGLLMLIGGLAILLPALALDRLFESSDRQSRPTRRPPRSLEAPARWRAAAAPARLARDAPASPAVWTGAQP